MEMTRKAFVVSSAAAAGIAAVGAASGAVSVAVADEAQEAAAFEWPGAEPVVDEGEIVETLET